MSLVENLINQIATEGLGGITKPIGFDMEDDTFSKLLEKQMNTTNTNQPANTIGEMEMPAGMIIEPFDGVEFANNVNDQLESLGDNKLFKEPIQTEPIEMKDIDMGDYFSKLLSAASEKNSDFLNFARRHASNAYGLFSRSYVTDMTDFVQDLASMI